MKLIALAIVCSVYAVCSVYEHSKDADGGYVSAILSFIAFIFILIG